jgi:hypothetical protein
MPAPVGGGQNNGNMGNTSINGMSANNGGFRYVTVPTPRATSQVIARQFFAAGGIRFDTQNQNLNNFQPQR